MAIGKLFWARMRRSLASQKIPSIWASLPSLLLGILLLGALILGAIAIESLLIYGPTTNLYQPLQNSKTMRTVRHGVLEPGASPSPALGRISLTYWIYVPLS